MYFSVWNLFIYFIFFAVTDTTLSTLAPSSSSIGITPNLGSFVSKPQPPNVVITSSDTLPAFTNVGTPVMSVTIPPQHIRALTPTTISKSNHNQVHPFQIQMPTVTHSVSFKSLLNTCHTIVSVVISFCINFFRLIVLQKN